MKFFRFLFSFLYTRNWHSGELELSLPRAILFASLCSVIFFGGIIIAVLQAPVVYEAMVISDAM